MTTTISKKNKHTKPVSKKRIGKHIGIRNTKRRSKNSKKSKTSKKNKPKNRLYKGGDNNLVKSIKRVVRRYNMRVLLDRDKLDKDKSDQSSDSSSDGVKSDKSDIVTVSGINVSSDDGISDTLINSSRIYSEQTNIREYVKLMEGIGKINESIAKDKQVAYDIDTFIGLLTSITKNIPTEIGTVTELLENENFMNAVNEYQKHIDDNTIGYIENNNKCVDGSITKLEDFIRCEVSEQKVNKACCVTS